MCGVSEVSGSWKIIEMRAPRISFSCLRLEPVHLLTPSNWIEPSTFPLERGEAHGGEHGLALARTALAHEAEAFAPRHVERQFLHGLDAAVGRIERNRQVADVENRLCRQTANSGSQGA